MRMALVALAACGLLGQTVAPRELTLMIGRGELMQFPNDLHKVVVAEPRIADAVVVSPREVMVNAKGVGRTTLVIWETGANPVRYDITVVPDTTDMDTFVTKMRGAYPEVVVSGNAEKVVLTGTVKNPDEAKRAEAMASSFAKQVVAALNTPAPEDPRQILLQVKFASVDRAALSELGFNYFSRNDKVLGALSTQQFQQPRFSQLQFENQEFANSTINFADILNLFIFRPDLNIGATIRALQGRNLLQILAEPNLIAIEGRKASFLAGGEFPFPTLTATTTGGAVAPVITVQFKKFGVQLDFEPRLTASGAIHLHVVPSVSSLDFSNAVTLQGFLIPAVATRQADTEVVLKDGETFAIAGLLDNRVIQVANRIPMLGDVPILGHLFRSRSTRKTQDELLVVITPRFVRPLDPNEPVKLPVNPEEFLPTTAQEKAERDAKAKQKQDRKKPKTVGKTGQVKP